MVEVGDDLLLFDHGPGAHHRLLEAGKGPKDVSHAFFSHLHYDHCLDYVRLLLQRWDQSDGTLAELKVFGPAGIVPMTEKLIGPEGAFSVDLTARTQHTPSQEVYKSRGGTLPRPWPAPEVTPFSSGDVIEGQGWTVQVISVPHGQPILDSFGFRLDADGASFAYSGDAGKSNAFIRLIEGADVLVHMCYQISGTAPNPEWQTGAAGHREVAEVAAEAGVRTLVVSHVSNQMDLPGVRERLLAEMAGIFSGNIIWGEDGLVIPTGELEPERHTG
jgi:ribonuclease BN (tRNA processing enzyme)